MISNSALHIDLVAIQLFLCYKQLLPNFFVMAMIKDMGAYKIEVQVIQSSTSEHLFPCYRNGLEFELQ